MPGGGFTNFIYLEAEILLLFLTSKLHTLNGFIYLSREFITTHQDDIGAIAGVVLEEIGHYIDSQINQSDAIGDEGELFSNLVLCTSFYQVF